MPAKRLLCFVTLRILFLWLCLPLAAWAQVSSAYGPWKLVSESNGICVYACRIVGNSIVPFKATMLVPASIEEISLVLEDAPRRAEWISNFGGSALLERKSDYEQTEYLRMRLPWPFMDRTALLRVRISVSADRSSAVIAGNSVACCDKTGLPVLVRAEIYESSFSMQSTPQGTQVSALVFIDPKGNLPKWVLNLFTGKVARKTLSGLRKQVGKRLYSAQEIAAMRSRILRYDPETE